MMKKLETYQLSDWENGFLGCRIEYDPDFYRIPDYLPETLECRRLDHTPGEYLMEKNGLLWLPIGVSRYLKNYESQISAVCMLTGKISGKAIYKRIGICKYSVKRKWKKYLSYQKQLHPDLDIRCMQEYQEEIESNDEN